MHTLYLFSFVIPVLRIKELYVNYNFILLNSFLLRCIFLFLNKNDKKKEKNWKRNNPTFPFRKSKVNDNFIHCRRCHFHNRSSIQMPHTVDRLTHRMLFQHHKFFFIFISAHSVSVSFFNFLFRPFFCLLFLLFVCDFISLIFLWVLVLRTSFTIVRLYVCNIYFSVFGSLFAWRPRQI